MVQASIDNDPIDMNFGNGEGTTVPSGETWKIRFSGMPGNNGPGTLDIGGKTVLQRDSGESGSVEAVVTGGTTITTTNYMSGHLSGFKL